MRILRANRVKGEVRLPGDKSISHRAAMFAAIADGETQISNYAASADCASTLKCLRELGISIATENDTVVITGNGKLGLTEPLIPLDCGNSGTTMRLISGILAGQEFTSTLTGDDSLRSRPMRRIIEPLEQMGAFVDSSDGKSPLTIHGINPLRAIEYTTPVASAQIKSCVLLAGLYAGGETYVIEMAPTRDHTERMLAWFGAEVRVEKQTFGTRICVSGEARLTARNFTVPGDISAAAFFMVAGACLPGSDICMSRVGMNSTRAGICTLMSDLGADIEVSTVTTVCNESVADIRVRGGLMPGRGISQVRGQMIANIIDEIPVLAVLGTQLSSGLEIRDAAELRVKETDRIAAVCTNLKRMGADVTMFDDGFRVGPSKLRGIRLDSYGDHRIAMAFAVAGLIAEGETEIIDAECAAVSFPGFFEALKGITAIA